MSEFTSINSLDLSINNGCFSSDNEENLSSEENSSTISYKAIKKIFSYDPIKEDNITEKDLYFIPDKKDTKSSDKQKTILFSTTESTKHNTQMMNKKRGRPSILNTNKIHDKFSVDNLLRKVNNHSLTSIVPFLNDILIALDIKEEFYQLSYEFKKQIKNNYFCESKRKLWEKLYTIKLVQNIIIMMKMRISIYLKN